MKDLKEPIVIHIPKTVSKLLNSTFVCKFRPTESEGTSISAWREGGCTCDSETETHIVCKTYHLTEFSAEINTNNKSGSENSSS